MPRFFFLGKIRDLIADILLGRHIFGHDDRKREIREDRDNRSMKWHPQALNLSVTSTRRVVYFTSAHDCLHQNCLLSSVKFSSKSWSFLARYCRRLSIPNPFCVISQHNPALALKLAHKYLRTRLASAVKCNHTNATGYH